MGPERPDPRARRTKWGPNDSPPDPDPSPPLTRVERARDLGGVVAADGDFDEAVGAVVGMEALVVVVQAETGQVVARRRPMPSSAAASGAARSRG